MSHSICGLDCAVCDSKGSCGGCVKTNGRPFQGECVIASCCQKKGFADCSHCAETDCDLKDQLMAEFNDLGIPDMPEVCCLYALKGSFINLAYPLSNGQTIQLLEDSKIYLGNQLCKAGSARCYGLAADESHLLVCEYGDNGSDPKIILYQKRRPV